MTPSIVKFTFNPFQENTYLVHDGSICIIIDPGCYTREEKEQLIDYIETHGLTPAAILLTHAHIDHVLGCSFLMEKYPVDCFMHPLDKETFTAVSRYAELYGFPDYQAAELPNRQLSDGERLQFGGIEFLVRHTPGHAPGHVVFYIDACKSVINGDVLFNGSFGRVDLPGGDLESLKRSIFEILFQFPPETIVYAGHGPETTIGKEQQSNYILQF